MTIEELGRRAVACKNWRWMRGMITNLGERVCNVDNEDDPKHVFVLTPGHFIRSLSASERTPRLDDPATLGCLLALVRQAWPLGEATTNVHANYSPERGHYRQWSCYYCTGGNWQQALAATEAEALVAALEAAP